MRPNLFIGFIPGLIFVIESDYNYKLFKSIKTYLLDWFKDYVLGRNLIIPNSNFVLKNGWSTGKTVKNNIYDNHTI